MSRDDAKRYWRSPGERPGPEAGTDRPAGGPQADPLRPAGAALGRREFLRLSGFTVGATAMLGCSRGVRHGVMPYLVRPEEVTPGRPYWYASVCGACPAACGILAKDRDGRPIKLEGNPDHPLSRGGLCPVGQASVLALYDSERLRRPLRDGRETSWDEIDPEIRGALAPLAHGGRVRFLTDSTTGPAERERIAAFLARFADGRHVTYDPVSVSAPAIADAHDATHRIRAVPRYRFDRAEVIVSFGADFLGTWLAPVEHTRDYRAGRRVEGAGERFSHHVQVESRLTLTGSNADRRIATPAGSAATLLAHLAVELARAGRALPPPFSGSLPACPIEPQRLAELARRLRAASPGRSLVVCGANDVAAQKLANHVNHALGNYRPGGTIDLENAAGTPPASDGDLRALLDEVEAGRVDALFVRGGNPLYDLPGGERTAAAFASVGLLVSFADRRNETASRAGFVCPEPHFLEAWGDSAPAAGLAALRQPAIRRIGSTRPLLESLAVWSGETAAEAYGILRDHWRRRVYPRRRTRSTSFEDFWNRALHDGFVRLHHDPGAARVGSGRFDGAAVSAPAAWSAPSGDAFALELHPSPAVLDGRHAHNPWLHELPDPIAKTVWDNFAAISPAAAESLGIASGDVVRLAAGDAGAEAIELPALVQPGQHERTVSVALGYGGAGTERFARIGPDWWEGRPTVEPGARVGTSAAPLLAWDRGARRFGGRTVRVEPTGRRRPPATTQRHHSLEVPARLAMGGETRRPIVKETTLAAWRDNPGAGGHGGHHAIASLWEDHPKSPHHWGLAIDLTACTGCSACVIACQAENNIPVVGRDEVGRAREMHWMRIDRYYSGEQADVDVVHMPMMCQHCDNAPCETVCPVQATAQSAEGLNQQVYNRCVGTRYCANNCPYKVRRFNWFEYRRDDRLQNLALNPDVTVRTRGVMEKCSLCVQRIQDAKVEAKRLGRLLRDGDVQPACAQSCPAGAIVFGDRNDPESALSHSEHDPRHYVLLEELGVRPSVGYLTLVRNREARGIESREP